MKEIMELMEHFSSLPISKLELNYHGIELKLSKEEGNIPSSLEKKENVSHEEKKGFAEEGNGGKEITAPLAGTFYQSAGPGEAPYVRVNDQIKKGQVLGVIEAMKMMNEIIAEEDGTIVEILVEDETMVEYGKPLFVIR